MSIPTMSPFDAVILFEQEPGNVSFLKACNPDDFDFSEEMDILVHNAFPNASPTGDKIYVFTCNNYFCYTWLVILPKTWYSIVILSKLKVPSVFITFLNELEKEFTRNVALPFDPLPTLDYTYSLLKSWKWVDKSVILAHLPDSSYNVTFDNKSFCFQEYNPLDFFPKKEIVLIWKTLMTGTGLHIIADFDYLYEVTFAAVSLSSPLIYKDLILITQNPEDERFQHIEDYAVVATTPDIDLSFYQFNYTIEAQNKPLNSKSPKATRDEFTAKNHKMLDVSVFMMDRILRNQPYNDLLNGPFITDDAEELFNSKKRKTPLLNADCFRLIENTRTFRNYRKKVTFRPTFRQYMLSNKPIDVLKALSLQHLKIIESVLPDIEKRYQNDKHFLSVLALHQAAVKKLLGKKNGQKGLQSTPSLSSIPPTLGHSSGRHISFGSESGAPQFSPYMKSDILESVLTEASSDFYSPVGESFSDGGISASQSASLSDNTNNGNNNPTLNETPNTKIENDEQ